ncbi:MAG: glycosyltransferase family 9 protein, partial [Nitrospinae bacterium]|nr:glycosyltransferase family 9 protein [Nitrospinota bacterium]
SMSERRWPPSRFAKTADLLAKKWNAKILFFGVASEKNLVDEVISKLDPSMNTVAINLAGKTSISQIVGVVKRLFLLVTNDTATMHIAGAAGTPIVALFLVHAFGAETGPYCENAVLLEPDISCFPCLHNSKCPHYECLGYIMPEHALEASKIAVALKEGKKADVDPAFFGQSYGMKERKVLVKRTLFDNEGYYDSRPVFKKVPTQHELLGRVYRHYFKKPETTGLTLETLRREIAEIYDAMPTREMASFLVDKIAVFKKLGEAAERGKNAVVKTRKYVKGGSMDAETMAVHVTEIETADYDLELLSLTHPELNPFIKLFAVGTGNLSGGPDAMLERKKALFEELKGSADEIEGLLAGLKPL